MTTQGFKSINSYAYLLSWCTHHWTKHSLHCTKKLHFLVDILNKLLQSALHNLLLNELINILSKFTVLNHHLKVCHYIQTRVHKLTTIHKVKSNQKQKHVNWIKCHCARKWYLILELLKIGCSACYFSEPIFHNYLCLYYKIMADSR